MLLSRYDAGLTVMHREHGVTTVQYERRGKMKFIKLNKEETERVDPIE